MKNISNRPEQDTSNGMSSVEELMIAKLGGKREYGQFRDRLMAKTKRPRRSSR